MPMGKGGTSSEDLHHLSEDLRYLRGAHAITNLCFVDSSGSNQTPVRLWDVTELAASVADGETCDGSAVSTSSTADLEDNF